VDRPRWTGCPAGCPFDHHEHDWQIVVRCNFCTALDWSARESLTTCWSVCPMRAVA
jgi:Fe-S-cluster-containing dehydrogenase component